MGFLLGFTVFYRVLPGFTEFFLLCRGNDECNKKQPSDCDTLEYRNGEGTFTSLTFVASSAMFGVVVCFRVPAWWPE